MEGLKRNLTGMMRSGPIKAMSFEEPLFPSKGRKNSNEVTRSKVFELNISPKRIALSFDSPPTISSSIDKVKWTFLFIDSFGIFGS